MRADGALEDEGAGMQIAIWGLATVVLLVAATMIAAAIDRRAGWERVPVPTSERDHGPGVAEVEFSENHVKVM